MGDLGALEQGIHSLQQEFHRARCAARRWALVSMAVVAAAALLFTAWMQVVGVRRLAEDLHRVAVLASEAQIINERLKLLETTVRNDGQRFTTITHRLAVVEQRLGLASLTLPRGTATPPRAGVRRLTEPDRLPNTLIVYRRGVPVGLR